MAMKSTEAGSRHNRRFAVSSNRDTARHRVRYVEAGGASVDTDECTFCQTTPELDWVPDASVRGSGSAVAVESDNSDH